MNVLKSQLERHVRYVHRSIDTQPYNNSLPQMLMDQFQLIQKLQVYLVIFLYGGIGMLRLSLARLRFQLVILIPCYSKSYLEGK